MCTLLNCSVPLHVNTRYIGTLQTIFLSSTPLHSLQKYVTPPVINMVYKWSTVVFFLVLKIITTNFMYYNTK